MLIRGTLRLIGAASGPGRVSRSVSQSDTSTAFLEASSQVPPPRAVRSPSTSVMPVPPPSSPEPSAVWTPAASAVMVPVAPPRRLRALGLSNPSPRQAASIKREAEDRNAGVRPSFHGRDFPSGLVDYRSTEGRTRLTRSLAGGFAEQFLNLTAAYQHQSEVAYCGLTTLTVALNALDVDPFKVWKGGWRWFSDATLDFCPRRGACQVLGLEEGAGLTLFDLRCVARANGARLKIRLAQPGDSATAEHSSEAKALPEKDLQCTQTRAIDSSNLRNKSIVSSRDGSSGSSTGTTDSGSSSEDTGRARICTLSPPGSLVAFRDELAAQCSHKGPQESVLIVNFSRAAIQQTGGGHFSPVAAYDSETDSALILDVARFKYPPFWIPVPLLHAAMAAIEPVTQVPRGWALVTAHTTDSSMSNGSDKSIDGDDSSSSSSRTSTISGFGRSLVNGKEHSSDTRRHRWNGPLSEGFGRASYVCCQDDGTHATCSTTCRAPHD